MESFFFNITDRRYKVTPLLESEESRVERVDISNGIVFLDARMKDDRYRFDLDHPDRMVMIVMVNRGCVQIDDHIGENTFRIKEEETTIFVSSRQKMQVSFEAEPEAEIFFLCIADFFLKRYLSGDTDEPIDLLYSRLQDEVSLEEVSRLRVDALSLYIINKLRHVQEEDTMQSLRAEHRVTEYMIHRFSLLDIAKQGVDGESLQLASRAKEILLAEFIDPPTIDLLARRCATNASKLKRVFKQVYQTTIYGYVQRLRLEEANLLLRKESLSIGEISRRVGYRHQGHFSKLFFETYGVHPRELLSRKS
jgi:AraC-like DNA-binding protein